MRDLEIEPHRVAGFLLQPASLSQSDASERSATLSRAFGVGLDVLHLWPPPVDLLLCVVVERPRRAPKLFGCISLVFSRLKALTKVDCGVLFRLRSERMMHLSARTTLVQSARFDVVVEAVATTPPPVHGLAAAPERFYNSCKVWT